MPRNLVMCCGSYIPARNSQEGDFPGKKRTGQTTSVVKNCTQLLVELATAYCENFVTVPGC